MLGGPSPSFCIQRMCDTYLILIYLHCKPDLIFHTNTWAAITATSKQGLMDLPGLETFLNVA